MLISLSLLPEIGRAMPHLTKERITESFMRREVSCHACPTHLVNKIRRSPALIVKRSHDFGEGKISQRDLSARAFELSGV